VAHVFRVLLPALAGRPVSMAAKQWQMKRLGSIFGFTHNLA
jgi:hypothetical protein